MTLHAFAVVSNLQSTFLPLLCQHQTPSAFITASSPFPIGASTAKLRTTSVTSTPFFIVPSLLLLTREAHLTSAGTPTSPCQLSSAPFSGPGHVQSQTPLPLTFGSHRFRHSLLLTLSVRSYHIENNASLTVTHRPQVNLPYHLYLALMAITIAAPTTIHIYHNFFNAKFCNVSQLHSLVKTSPTELTFPFFSDPALP